jgi:ribonuclease-3
MTREREEGLRALEALLGHHFADLGILDQALTHTSRANEDPKGETRHNEPLEFLGDSVLGFVVADLLHRRDPHGDEGVKSKARADLVSAASLAPRAERLGLQVLLVLGRGEEKTGGRGKSRLWADAFEAVVAALYLDGGLETARRFIEEAFGDDLTASPSRDPKSALQEVLQGQGEPLPDYVLLASEGPSHRKRFRVGCVISGRTVSEGEGFSKKTAQQEAARKALEALTPPVDRSTHPRDTPPRRRRPRPGRG